ncbi:MAG: FKBP-type peptidyl-prolyl cis-trans isomerase [Cyclobacteriaceae bacterium]
MRVTKMLIGLMLVLCVACDKSERETPSGLKYKLVKEGTGAPAKVGEVLVFNFVFKDSKDSVWRNTYEGDFPPYIVMPDTAGSKQEDGMTQMLRALKPGDSAIVNIHIKDFFKDIVRQPIPPQFDSTLTFTYQIKAEKIMNRDSFQIEMRNLEMAKTKEQWAKDSVAIENYLAKNNIKAQRTESGVYYAITQPGKGENGKTGQYASVNYTGYTLEGKYFDTSVKEVAMKNGLYNAEREKYLPYAPYEVTIDRSGVIKGWHEALKVLNKGAKATIFVPSALAYGPQRRGEVIKENEVLAFDLEVVDLKNEKPEAPANKPGSGKGDKRGFKK